MRAADTTADEEHEQQAHVEDAGRAIPVREPESARGRRRLLAIDGFRGAVLGFMLFTPPIGEHYAFLRHAPWNGWTASDLVFPAFLVTSGASLAFLLRAPVTGATRMRLVRRVIALLVLGVFYNAWGTTGADLSQVRVTGVLQLIGVSGAIAATVVLLSRRRGQDRPFVVAGVALLILAVYGIGLAALGGCEGVEVCSPYGALDRSVLGDHAYAAGTLGFDPEGLAVMVAAAALVLIGYLSGRHLRLSAIVTGRTAAVMAGAAVALIGAGLVLDGFQPMNKRLHTPAFSLFAAGIAVGGLSLFGVAFDRPVARWSKVADRARGVASVPFVVLGRNALVVYLGERILLQAAAHTRVGDVTAQEWILDNVVPFSGASAELGYGLLLLAVVLGITGIMHALRWHVSL